MLIFHVILAAAAVVALAARPGTTGGSVVALAAAGIDIALGAAVDPVIHIVGPMFVFLAAALTLAGTLERAGTAERIATALAGRARGSSYRLYAYVCLVSAALTATVSLDGAVVLMVPVLLALRRYHAPFGSLFLGTVVVANAFSIAVPQGNPTNLLIIARLGIAPTTYLAHMALPGLLAALMCAGAVAVQQRRHLAKAYAPADDTDTATLTRPERTSAAAFAAAALAAWTAPFLGLPTWWPFAAAVALVLIATRTRPATIVPWRIGVQIASTLLVVQAVGNPGLGAVATGLAGLLAAALVVGAAAALLNNLPVGASAVALLTTAPLGYAACIGLAVGSLATPQGSVATLIASELATPDAPSLPVRRFAPLAAAAVAVATLLTWLTL
ncbi:MAG TPA: SLC13 family permease [Solirubrobacteraceae bacterium]|nr:SLC13 family permease [Solirubrobacteraceae bacterium]